MTPGDPQPAVMSIEYTIDIQLTELGFPDILQPGETSVRETSSSEDSPTHSPTALPPTPKERLLIRGQQAVHGKEAAKQTSSTGHTTVVSTSPLPETLPCKPLNPARSLRDEQAAKGTAPPELSESSVNHPSAGPEATDVPQLIIDEDDSRVKDVDDAAGVRQDVEDDSDDSEVSEVYEEEEADEEEGGGEDEEGLNTGMTLSLFELL